MIIRRDDAFRTVCELLTPTGPNTACVGTGIFISSPAGENRAFAWIVTASHVACGTNQHTQLIIATSDGKAQKLQLSMFGSLSAWRHHPVADVSAFLIHATPLNEQFLSGRFFPYDHLNIEHVPVSRDYELTSIGFPRGLGTNGSFSPFTFRSFASSGFVTLPRVDTKANCEFFCLENPSMGGYSGCPVFDLGYSTNGIMTTTKEKTWCHGIMHGTMSDNTGGKIAMVTPAFYLKDIIDCVTEPSSHSP